jgi:serine/threonine protein kinase
MQNNGYAHRDLKFQNILLFGSGSDSGSVDKIVYKLSDFGSARGDLRLANGSIKFFTTVIRTPRLMAPEMSESPHNAFLTDTYSMDVILYQLSHSGEFPFNLVQNCPQNCKRRRQEVRELAAMKRLPETIIYRILYQKN